MNVPDISMFFSKGYAGSAESFFIVKIEEDSKITCKSVKNNRLTREMQAVIFLFSRAIPGLTAKTARLRILFFNHLFSLYPFLLSGKRFLSEKQRLFSLCSQNNHISM